MEALRKKHLKEKSMIQKNQCIAIDKLCRSKGKNDTTPDAAIKEVVMEQTEQYTEMVERHRKEDWELTKAHLMAQDEMLKKLMETSQAQQMKELDIIFERDNKEMKSNQAKVSYLSILEFQAASQPSF